MNVTPIRARRPLVAHLRPSGARACLVLDVRALTGDGALLDLGDRRPDWVAIGHVVELGIFEAAPEEAIGVAVRGRVVRVVESVEGCEMMVELEVRTDGVRAALARLGGPTIPPPSMTSTVALRPPGRAVPPPLPRRGAAMS